MIEVMQSCYIIKVGPMRIAIADLCDYYGKGLIITRINVPRDYRGQGHARELLRQITADADKTHTTLFLEIMSSDGLNYDQLEAWYKRAGFRSWHGIYKRKPK